MQAAYSISDLAQEFGITPRTLRHYEDKGLLRPARRGNQRVYSRGDRVRLRLILRGRRLGFSLDEIAEILDLYHEPHGEARQRAYLLQRLRGKRRQLEEQLRCIHNMLQELDQIERRLQGEEAK